MTPSTLCVVLMVCPLKEHFLRDRRKRKRRREVIKPSGDCLFVVFTAKPLRTYRHFHQHSAVHSTHFLPGYPELLMSYFPLTVFCIFWKPLYTSESRASLICVCEYWLPSPSGNTHPLYSHLHEENPAPAIICLQLLSWLPLRTTLSLKCTNHNQPVSFDDSWLDGRYQPPRLQAQTKPWAYSTYSFI